MHYHTLANNIKSLQCYDDLAFFTLCVISSTERIVNFTSAVRFSDARSRSDFL